MPRALWSGSLSFGLVNVPVVMVPAVRDLDLHFRQLHAKDGAPIDVQRWCSKEDVEVGWDEIDRAFELDDGGQVIVTDEELEAIEPRRTRTIEIESFVDLSEVDPIYFDHPYYLLPASGDDGSARAYRLLTDVMARTERAALGQFVMRAKEYLAIVRSHDGALMLSTMLFADEVRDGNDVENAAQKSHKPSAQQLKAAAAVIEELSGKWEPGEWKDRYRRRLRDVVARKRKGQTIKAPKPREAVPEMPDLMAALEQTLADMREGKSDKRREKQEA
ncbi:MAG TPA: Ku protein [Solirubrobacteraceae bacterium]|nr:Ku protein [Solirubrobacteraceae bacterium]